MNRIIILEDDLLKAKLITEYLNSICTTATIDCADSYNSGLRKLKNSDYSLLVLDMSMPTFSDDFLTNESSFEKFAGIMILRELKRIKKNVPTILFTMFDDFGSSDYSISLKEMHNELMELFPSNYLGYVYFESGSINWKNEIKRLIDAHNINC